ncbi:MAG TPA: cation diffusion facilitator family transporter [Candidatus Sulfotelmatobacter sp.]|nr:cation diffusion facilitator family transporter [Candidatus Sulfotelmatobacter sp.]
MSGSEADGHAHSHGDHPHGTGEHAAQGAHHEHGILADAPPDALRVLAISSVGLALVALVELVVAIGSGSAAVLADGLHNLGDVFTTVALGVAFILSRRAPNRRFPYGYHRAEDVAGFIVLLLVIASAVASGVTSMEHLLHRQSLSHPEIALLASLVGFAGNELVAQYKVRAGRRLSSVALVADGQHSRVDGLASLGAAVGVLASWLALPVFDPVAGLVITAVIAWVAWETARNVTGRLLDQADASLLAAITDTARSTPGVLAVTDTRARWTGRRVHAEVTLELPPQEPLARAHALGEEVRHRLYHRIESLESVIVHLDPAGDRNAHSAVSHHGTHVQEEDVPRDPLVRPD